MPGTVVGVAKQVSNLVHGPSGRLDSHSQGAVLARGVRGLPAVGRIMGEMLLEVLNPPDLGAVSFGRCSSVRFRTPRAQSSIRLGEPVLITPYDLQQGLLGTPGLVTGTVPHLQQ